MLTGLASMLKANEQLLEDGADDRSSFARREFRMREWRFDYQYPESVETQ